MPSEIVHLFFLIITAYCMHILTLAFFPPKETEVFVFFLSDIFISDVNVKSEWESSSGS